jgi:class 3 adenylate cyclase/tetratricopeptide (TPR) repeat protein
LQICPSCGEENPPRFRLCGICGAALAAAAIAPEVRKTVTIVFSDLKGSTNLGEALDSEALREVMSRYFDTMRAVLERHGGTVEKFIGDAVMAVFGLPRLHEDDALRAVRAASEMVVALQVLNEELHDRWGVELVNRTGVNTGEVVAGDPTGGQRLVTGDAVNVAARLEQAAGENEVLLGETTLGLVRDAVDVEAIEPLPLKGKAELVAAYRLRAVHAREAIARHLDAPLIGRADELAALSAAYEGAAAGAARLVTIVGDAGVGKSRLIAELVGRVPNAQVVTGRCLSYGEGITYWALGQIVRQAAGIQEDDTPDRAGARVAALMPDEPEAADRLAAAIGLTAGAFEPADTTWAARRFLEAVTSADRPLIVHFEDIHWAEPTLLDLIEGVGRTAASEPDAPMLLICSTRHELLDDRPTWASDVPDATRIDLEPLPPDEAEAIIDHLLGSDRLPRDLSRRVVEAAAGNPLYVEQYVSMLVDAGDLRLEDGRWTFAGKGRPLAVPPSITALLAARIDRLDLEERAVVERGAVIGLAFYRGAVEELSPEPVRPNVGSLLLQVTGRHLVRPIGEFFASEETFEFLHVLIREAAYGGILKRARAEHHERFAGWLERVTSGRQLEVEEIIGYHLEQAHRFRSELGPLDVEGHALGARAAQRLAAAGRRAFARGDMPAASNLLHRAVALLPEADAERVELLCDLAEALLDVGELQQAETAAEQAIAASDRLEDERLTTAGVLARLLVRYVTDSDGWSASVVREAERAIPILEEIGDHANLARAWRLLGSVHGTACRYAEAEHATRQSIDHARLAGDTRQVTRNLPAYAMSALYGPTPVPLAVERCGQVLEQAPGDLRAEGIVRCTLAHLEAMAGNFDAARALYAEGRELFSRLGGRLLIASTSLDSGRVELLAGDPEAALAELQPDYDALEEMGERYLRSTLAGLIARAHLDAGRDDLATRYAEVCQELAAPDDVEAQAMWRCVRARVLAAEGGMEDAVRLAREAVEMAESTDSPVLRAGALDDLARVLATGGRNLEADEARATAEELLEQKGNVSALRHVRAVAEFRSLARRG